MVGAALEARVAYRASRLSDLSHWQTNSASIQLAQLRRILRHARSTDFGRRHDFDRLRKLPDSELLPAYRAAVPLRDWGGFRETVARMREGGEPDVLWPGKVMHFCQTSGTTAGDKFIPLTKEMFRSNYRSSLDIFANSLRFGVSVRRICTGKSIFLGGSTDVDVNEHGICTGDLSGLVVPLIKWPLTECYLPGPKIALISHWPTKIDAMARACMNEDVRMLSGMCSWALVLFERMVEIAREQGRRVETVRELWPNIELFVHGGVRYDPFLPRVNQAVFGDPSIDFPQRLELYPASEGFVAMQDRPGERGLRLNIDVGNFLEFVPLDRIDDADAEAFTCDRVEKGVRYVVVLTTCAGMYRYILGDVVEFDTIPDPSSLTGAPASGRGASGGPARVRIVGRHRHFINAFGENLIVEHIETAVSQAAQEAGVLIGEFTAAPVYPGPTNRPGLEVAIEFDDPGPQQIGEAQLHRFAHAMDTTLKSLNVDYGIKRTDGFGMAPPTITPLPVGAFHAWMDSKGKLGGQHKCPRCANHRDILEGVLEVSGVASRSHTELASV